MQRYYVNLVRQHSRFEIAETPRPHHPPHHTSASRQQSDEDENMNGAGNSSHDDSDSDQLLNDDSVVTEPDYEEGLRDQWIPMGE